MQESDPILQFNFLNYLIFIWFFLTVCSVALFWHILHEKQEFFLLKKQGGIKKGKVGIVIERNLILTVVKARYTTGKQSTENHG